MTFSLARIRWPHAKIFSLTSGAAVMKMNTQLGYQPVTFDDLTDDEAFWKGCEGCVNVEVLRERNRKFCICTAMLFDPEEHLPAKIPQEVIERINRLEKRTAHPQPLPGEGGTDCLKAYQMADCSVYNKLKRFAAENRKNQTEAESILWNYIKGKQLGASFRRQHIIGPFIADFSAPSIKLIIEVDGGYHQLPGQQISDEERSNYLQSKGLTILRFTNDQIIADTDNVITQIQKAIWTLKNNQ